MLKLLVLFTALTISLTVTATEKPMGFRDWKSSKIQASAEKIKALRLRLVQPKPATSQDLSQDLKQEIQQEEWNLDAAKELTVRHYLSIYVMNLEAPNKFELVAGVLTKEEMALFLEAFAKPTQVPQAKAKDSLNSRVLKLQALSDR